MNDSNIAENIQHYINVLCNKIGHRHVGSSNNKRAVAFAKEVIEANGFNITEEHFDCIDWECGEVELRNSTERFTAFVSPYSMPCDVTGKIFPIATVDELENSEIMGRIILIHGELAKEQMMPKGFPFYYPDEHRKIHTLLEEKSPAAIIASTSRNPALAGGWYPFPMFEDGNFDIPSVYMKDVDGERILRNFDGEYTLRYSSERIPSTGSNIIARKGTSPDKKIVVTAHIDTKKTTPGALDNGAGVAVLLALSGLLREYSGDTAVEIAVFNGEDYYAAPGQVTYLANNAGSIGTIQMAVNIDAAGFRGHETAVSLYECPSDRSDNVKKLIAETDGFVEGEQWYQGDHMVFVQSGVPAVAITSANFTELTTHYTHTEKDRPELLDYDKLAGIARFITRIIQEMYV